MSSLIKQSIRTENQSDVSLTMVVAKGGSVNIGGLLFSRASAFLMEILLARFLRTSGYGLYSLSRTVVNIVDSFTNLGLDQAVVRYGAIYRDKKDYARLKGLLFGSSLIIIGVSLSGSLLLFMGAKTIAIWFNEPGMESLIKIFAWILAPSGLVVNFGAFARSQLRYDLDIKGRAISVAVFSLLAVLIFVIFLGYGSKGAIFGLLLASLISTVIGILYTVHLFPQALTSLHPVFHIKKWLRFAIPTLLLSTSYLLMRQSSRILLGYFATAEAVGLFTAAASVSNNLTIFMGAINPVFAPLAAALHERRKQIGVLQDLEHTFQISTRWMLTLTLPLLIVIWVMGSDLMSLFGSGFRSADMVLTVLSFSQFINIVTGPVGIILQMTGKQDLEFLNGLSALILNLFLGVIFVPKYGAFGAGVAAAVAVSTIHLVRLAEVRILLKMTPYNIAFIKCIVSGMITLLLAYFLRSFLNIDYILLRFLIGSAVIAVFYFGILLLLGLEPDDKKIVHRVLLKMRF